MNKKERLLRLKDNISEYEEDERPFENRGPGYRNNPFVPMSCFRKQWTKSS